MGKDDKKQKEKEEKERKKQQEKEEKEKKKQKEKEEKERKKQQEKEEKERQNSEKKNKSGNSSLNNSVNYKKKNESYYELVEEKGMSQEEQKELVNILGSKFIDTTGEEVEYDLKNNMQMVVVVVAAKWCQVSQNILQALDTFQQKANFDGQQLEVVYVSLDPFQEQALQVVQSSEQFMLFPYQQTQDRLKIAQILGEHQSFLPRLAVIDYEGKVCEGFWLQDDIINRKRKPQKCLIIWQKLMEQQPICKEDSEDGYESESSCSNDSIDEWGDMKEKETVELKEISKRMSINKGQLQMISDRSDQDNQALKRTKSMGVTNPIMYNLHSMGEVDEDGGDGD